MNFKTRGIGFSSTRRTRDKGKERERRSEKGRKKKSDGEKGRRVAQKMVQ